MSQTKTDFFAFGGKQRQISAEEEQENMKKINGEGWDFWEPPPKKSLYRVEVENANVCVSLQGFYLGGEKPQE